MPVFKVILVNLLTPIYRPQLINPNLLTPIYRPQLILPPLICLQGPNYYVSSSVPEIKLMGVELIGVNKLGLINWSQLIGVN